MFIGGMFAATALAASPARYPPDDALAKGDTLNPPAEFIAATATLTQVLAWTHAIANGSFGDGAGGDICKDPAAVTERIDMSGMRPLIVVQVPCDTAQNPTYLVFERRVSGYRYVDTLDGALFNFVLPDRRGRARVVTAWHVSENETDVSLEALGDHGFEGVGTATLSGSDADQAQVDMLLRHAVTQSELERIFGKAAKR